MAPKQWISIRNILIYLETKFCPNRRIFVFWRPFWIQNGRHMVQHVLLTVNIHFHWNPFIFEFLTIYFYIGGHFENFKNKEHNFEWWSIFVSSFKWIRCTVSAYNIFCTLVTMTTAAILNFFNPPKAATHYGGYSYKVSWSLMKGIQNFFESPLFCLFGNCSKVCPTNFFWLISFH
jgi:hypothetical protein